MIYQTNKPEIQKEKKSLILNYQFGSCAHCLNPSNSEQS
uniref:Uncharacterized protein n=1 Tax=Rhizophora mucronata TaxID=61149 RepID=A0A2P2QPM7_RHIMU